ncbi:NADH-quinone oxidoreductase subunit NuoF [Propionibacterium freudenreichii]|uniref:NADH-quinone oxidoreductase subunit NuoF n=1 Tax=Propionibacterium freudenreichii TaxID=1744 RepID=UPI00254DB98B|nr:NADH-quinone oxidoreductase subunit NuoF [Propionibacterium freudenreichii]MDK9662257.1 NADH-quinone oxidoreductase subunit NuoF [Propionibacterium freudenreichii]
MTDTLTPILTKDWDTPDSWKLDTYVRGGGYDAARKALTTMKSPEVIDLVKASGLRGRGGAGFPTGMKWSFIPQDNPKPKYLVVNCDESEPGTCKDMPMLIATPHTLLEGIIIACYAVNAHHAFIFCRGEVLHAIRRLSQAVREAYDKGYLGKDLFGTGYDLDIVVHAGAGAYICGEETALLSALEGHRGQPRLRPPFPAVEGLYACPTVVNNAESIASVPAIVRNGAEWYQSMGTEKSKGATIYSLSGHVKRPGQFEAPLGITFRQILELGGGVRDGHQLKFFTPGGSSTPMFTPEQLDVPLDYEGVSAAGSILGTKALQVFDETTSVVRTTLRWTEFYKHESCGKCTPCREGSWWLVQTLRNLEAGKGQEGDVDKLLDVCDNVSMKSFCTLADGFVACITSAIKHFRSEFEAGYHTPAWELFPYEKSALFADPDRESITMTGATA